MTSPLTFTLVAGILDRACQEYARSLRVPEAQVREMSAWTPYLLGSFHGRVYHNLLHWYRIAGIGPGYPLSRRGLGASAPAGPLADDIAEPLRPFTFDSRLRGAPARTRIAVVYLRRLFGIEAVVRDFRAGFDRFRDRYEAMDYLHGEHAYAMFRRAERDLSRQWGAVMVLDAILMSLTGAVVASAGTSPRGMSWSFPAAPPAPLVAGSGDPAGAPAEFALRDEDPGAPDRAGARELPVFEAALAPGAEDAGGPGVLRRWLSGRIRARARRCAAYREELRSCRLRAYRILGRMIRVMGEDLAARRIIEAPGDIYQLTVAELCACYDRVPMPDLRTRISERRADRAVDLGLIAPARFTTVGATFSDTALAAAGWVPRTGHPET
ncbi:hypothetical protein [Nocardia sp. NPDC024068]|uniref:hypothetical protein n=1 Tax=Nocardia sp. NPDC024068 TaxID=3157197 RepID=UPI0033D53296